MFFGDVQLVPLSLDFIIQISQWWPFVRPGPPAKTNAMFTLDLSVSMCTYKYPLLGNQMRGAKSHRRTGKSRRWFCLWSLNA